MRFSIPPELVPKLRELQSEYKHYLTHPIVKSEDSVVMTGGMGASMFLTLDGRVIVHDDFPDVAEPREANDPKEMYTAIVVGAKRRNAPELLSLLPSRPDTAVDCVDCKGRGWRQFGVGVDGKPVEIVCWDCGGIGWIDNA